jgi:hypothetical protein
MLCPSWRRLVCPESNCRASRRSAKFLATQTALLQIVSILRASAYKALKMEAEDSSETL